MELKKTLFQKTYKNKNNINLKALLTCAIDAAKLAGNFALKNSHKRHKTIQQFKHDVKLELDKECQKIITQHIRKHFPTHSILGEEDDKHTTSTNHSFWIIDPIDGTVNFFHGIPFWCCSVAYVESGTIVAGAVYAPELKLLYTATIESKALCNGKPIYVSKTKKLEKAIVLTGLDKKEEEWGGNFKRLKKIATSTQKVRILGSAALDICFVASGQADCYFESYVYLWDIAAAGLIAKQAGGKCSLLNYDKKTHQVIFLATNSACYNNFLKLV